MILPLDLTASHRPLDCGGVPLRSQQGHFSRDWQGYHVNEQLHGKSSPRRPESSPMLSSSHLRAKGPQTGINWQKMHEAVLEYLLKALRTKKQCVVALFRAWDDELFPDTETSIGTRMAGGAESASGDARRRALAALDKMPEIDEHDDGDQGGDQSGSGERNGGGSERNGEQNGDGSDSEQNSDGA
ncbi:hypothetical protein GGX14DRAFT_401532 [Mycena pura]|uniref:Uncharacterized protein n=1 Tax=Mycena pura TaxID=153505 RepID=A0AAD6V7G6_9AGAR|nr:hypothetical protein GGX14DRAFT_401532 [Mycena pura]